MKTLMVSVFAHILFIIVLGATMVATPPRGTLQLELFDFDCKLIDELNVEEYVIGTTHLTFQTIDRGRLKYAKNDVKEIHGSVVGKDGKHLAKHPTYDLENISNSECKIQLANLETK